MKSLRLLAMNVIAACAHLASSGACAADPVFAAQPLPMRQQLSKQREYVSALVAQRMPGQRLSKIPDDLALLQKLIDDKVIPRGNTWGLQALGVVFGDVLVATIPGLAWSQVSDEYGTDPTLRYRATNVQINALTLLSKRIERGEDTQVRLIAQEVAKSITALPKNYR